MTSKIFNRLAQFGTLVSLLLLISFSVAAQSGASRPRRTLPAQPTDQTTSSGNANTNPQTDSSTNDQPATSQTGAPRMTRTRTVNAASPASSNSTANNSNTTASNPPATFAGRADTMHAYQMLQQKKYADAESEAIALTKTDPKNSEAWKIAGFAELSLEKYADAVRSLERARELQRADTGKEDPNTIDALATAYIRSENFERALPLLVIATTNRAAPPNAELLFFRGLAEYRTKKPEDAERSFSAAVRANPNDAVSHFYLGRIAYEHKDTVAAERSFNAAVRINPKDSVSYFYLGRIAFERNNATGAINSLNRATTADPKFAEAWTLLIYAYLRRAADAKIPNAAEADNLSAVRAAENLTKLRPDETSYALYGRALIFAKQYARAATALEKATASENADGTTLYLLGVAHSRANNSPQAINALNRAAKKTPDDVNIYRELGYAYEVSKDYKNALAAYQKGSSLAPDDASLKESIERVKPFAK